MQLPVALLIGIALLLPSVAPATEGVFTMHGIKQTKYYPVTDNEYRILYQIKAEKRITTKNREVIVNSVTQQGARKAMFYQEGRIAFEQILIEFKLAYFHRGVLYLEHATGNIGDLSFYTRELQYNEQTQLLSAERITLRRPHGLSIKKGYQHLIPYEPLRSHYSNITE